MAQELGSKVEALRPVRKLSELDEDAVAANPVFGFKRDLVRLIGNMCWRHRKNQDMVRVGNLFTMFRNCVPDTETIAFNDTNKLTGLGKILLKCI